MTLPRRAEPARVAGWIAAVVEDVFASLEEVRARMLGCHRAVMDRGERLTSDDIAQLRPELLERLRREGEGEVVVGMGMIVTPGLLADEPRRLEWWHTVPGRDPAFLNVDLDPESIGFYDYAEAEWFAVPRRTGARHVVGPYVDYGGTDRYMLTLTLPVRAEGEFLGVVGADVPVSRFEALLLPGLAALDDEVILINAERRIILSNSARRLTGSLLREPDPAGSRPEAAGTRPTTCRTCRGGC